MSTPTPAAVVDRIRRHLVALKMPLALEHLDNLIRRFEQGQLNPYELLESLLAEERGLRESRRIKVALMTARLTTLKTLDSFDFAFQPSLDRNRVLSLASLEFIERREVVHFLVTADRNVTHPAGVKVDHLGEDGGFGTAHADSGASSGDTGIEAPGVESARDSARDGPLARDRAAASGGSGASGTLRAA